MNSVILKKSNQKYNWREENLLTNTENEKRNSFIVWKNSVSSDNLIIESEYTPDLSEDENASEGERWEVIE